MASRLRSAPAAPAGKAAAPAAAEALAPQAAPQKPPLQNTTSAAALGGAVNLIIMVRDPLVWLRVKAQLPILLKPLAPRSVTERARVAAGELRKELHGCRQRYGGRRRLAAAQRGRAGRLAAAGRAGGDRDRAAGGRCRAWRRGVAGVGVHHRRPRGGRGGLGLGGL